MLVPWCQWWWEYGGPCWPVKVISTDILGYACSKVKELREEKTIALPSAIFVLANPFGRGQSGVIGMSLMIFMECKVAAHF